MEIQAEAPVPQGNLIVQPSKYWQASAIAGGSFLVASTIIMMINLHGSSVNPTSKRYSQNTQIDLQITTMVLNMFAIAMLVLSAKRGGCRFLEDR